MILNPSKKYKTIKHIVLSWGDRELLRYPYPIVINAVSPLGESEYLPEITYPYRGTLFSIYFTADDEYPMHLKTKFTQSQLVITSDAEEERLDYDDRFMPKPVTKYHMYFLSFICALGLSLYCSLVYKIYCEMFDQSQLIVKNMDLDRENLFEGIEDIKIDVSESSYKEDLLDAQNRDAVLAKLGYVRTRSLLADFVEAYYQAHNYRYGLEESKNLLLTHLGEHNSEGYSGVNENFFRQYGLRLQLVLVFGMHLRYTLFNLSPIERRDSLERLNLWKMPIFDENTSREFSLIRLVGLVELFYLRRFYRKFRLFVK